MEILRTIALYSESKNEKFILIGGQALCYYGHKRQTSDIDLIVPENHKQYWTDIMCKLKYKSFQNDERFSRYHTDNYSNWPIDLMYVDSETFDKLFKDSTSGTLNDMEVQIISPLHLALLKIHSLKHFQEHRYVKDFQDLVWILKNKLSNLSDNELKAYCKKYADQNLFNKLKDALYAN